MKIIRNGELIEVSVVKHFDLGNEKYIIYKDPSNVCIGMVDQNRIIAPNPNNIQTIMEILNNFINKIPNNNIMLLSKDLDVTLEEISYQIVNITIEQLRNMIDYPIENYTNGNQSSNIQSNNEENVVYTNSASTETPNVNFVSSNKVSKIEKQNKALLAVIIVVFLIVVLAGSALLFGDKLFGGSSSGSSSKTTLKDKIFKSKTIEGVEIPSGLKTYAARVTFGGDSEIYEYYDLIIRYDKNGEVAYYEYTDNFIITEEDRQGKTDAELQKIIEEKKCIYLQKINLPGFNTICKIHNGVYTSGYSFNDKTLEAGLLNTNITEAFLEKVISNYKEAETENLAIEAFNKAKDTLSAKKGDFLIMANKKVELSQ